MKHKWQMNFLLSPYLILNWGWPQVPVSLKGKGMAGGMNEWMNEVNSRQSHHGRGIRKWGSQNTGPVILTAQSGMGCRKSPQSRLPSRNPETTWQDLKTRCVWMEKGSDFQRGVPESLEEVTWMKTRRRWGRKWDTHTQSLIHTQSHTLTYTHIAKALASSPPTSLRSLTLNRSKSKANFRLSKSLCIPD